MPMDTKEPLVLKLQDSLHTRTLDNTNHLLQAEAYARLPGILEGVLDDCEKISDKQTSKISDCRSHNNIYVEGARGSGKTLFILNNIQLYLEKKDQVLT